MKCSAWSCFFLFLFVCADCIAMEVPDPFVLVRSADVNGLASIITGSQDAMRFRDSVGNTLLHVAQNPEVVAILLKNKADINARNVLQETPLHKAIWDGSPEDFSLVALLLDHGASLTCINANKQNPVHLAVSKHPEFVHRLLSHVPRCSIELILYPQHKSMELQVLCCFKRWKDTKVCAVPRDVQLLLLGYCKLPPYRFVDEQEKVNKLLFEKLDVVKTALEAQDHLEITPAFLELRYWPHDRSKLLDPLRVHQYVPDIIASIGRLADLTLTYTDDLQKQITLELPSAE